MAAETDEMFECSPLKPFRTGRVLRLDKRKIENVTSKLTGVIAIALNEPQRASSKKECDNCARLVNSIKEKLATSNRERKIQLVSSKDI